MRKSSHFDSVKAIVALLIILLAFGVFLLFYNNSEIILQDVFYPFVTLTAVGFSLLLGLMYLVSNSRHPHVQKVHKSPGKKHKKGRK